MSFDREPEPSPLQPTEAATSGALGGVAQSIGGLSPEAIALLITKYPARRDAIMRQLYKTHGTAAVQHVIAIADPTARHDTAQDASRAAIAASLSLFAQELFDAHRHINAAANPTATEAGIEPTLDALRCDNAELLEHAKTLTGMIKSAPLTQAQRNQLTDELRDIRRSYDMYSAALDHFAASNHADLASHELATEVDQLGQLFGFERGELRATGPHRSEPQARLRERVIREHLDAALEAARSIRAGNHESARLETHVWNAHDELANVPHDRAALAPYRSKLRELIQELDAIGQPGLLATLDADRQLEKLRELAR